MIVPKSNKMRGKQEITKIKNKNEILIKDKREITGGIQQFYEQLFTSLPSISNPHGPPKHILNVSWDEIPEISLQEHALQKMKTENCPGKDQLKTDMLKMGGKDPTEAVKV